MVYFQEKYVLVTYDTELDCIVTKWTGFASFEEIKTGNLEGLDLLKEKKTKKWLIDNRQAAAMDSKSKEWIHTVFTPLTIESGIRLVAVVQPENIFSQIVVEQIVLEIKELGFILKNFDSLKEAREWLA